MSIGHPPSTNANVCGQASCRDACNGIMGDQEMDHIEIAGGVITDDNGDLTSVIHFCGDTGLGWSDGDVPEGLGVISLRPGLKLLR